MKQLIYRVAVAQFPNNPQQQFEIIKRQKL